MTKNDTYQKGMMTQMIHTEKVTVTKNDTYIKRNNDKKGHIQKKE